MVIEERLNEKVYGCLIYLTNMGFYKVAKEFVYDNDEEKMLEDLLQFMMSVEGFEASLEEYSDKLNNEFTLEQQFAVYDTVSLLSEAFRDDLEIEQINKDNIIMVIKAAAKFIEYEKANGKDFFEFVDEYLANGKNTEEMIDKMSRYFRLSCAKKHKDDSTKGMIEYLKKENKLFLQDFMKEYDL